MATKASTTATAMVNDIDNTIDNGNTIEADESEDWLLDCHCEAPKTLLTLLQSLYDGKRNEGGSAGSAGSAGGTSTHTSTAAAVATFYCAPPPHSSITIHTQPTPQFQSTLELPATINTGNGLFSRYRVGGGVRGEGAGATTTISSPTDFCVSLPTLLECLQVLTLEHGSTSTSDSTSTSTSMGTIGLSLQYHSRSEILKLETTTSCGMASAAAIAGLVPPHPSHDDDTNSLSTAFGARPIIARVLCNSKELQDVAELEFVAGVSSIAIGFGRSATNTSFLLTMTVIGHSSQCTVQLPMTRMELLLLLPEDDDVDVEEDKSRESATTTPRTVQFSYPFAAWRRAMKPLELANETCISINAAGVLAIQHQLVVNNGTSHGNHNNHGNGEETTTNATATTATAAYCDCLLLPLVQEELQEEDDETTAVGSSSRQSTQAPSYYYSQQPTVATTTSQNERLQRQRQRQRRRHSSAASHPTATSSSSKGEDGDDDASTIATAYSQRQRQQRQQQQQQQDSTDEEEFESSPILPPRPLLFGSNGNANRTQTNIAANTSVSSNSTSTTTAMVNDHSRRRRRRHHRQRQQQRRIHSTSPKEPQNDDSSQDTELPDQDDKHENESNRDHHPVELLSCSSPEVVYGGDDED